jgi:hypothetical protein
MSFWFLIADTAPSAQASRDYFSEDWATENATNWSRILRSFKGKADVHALELTDICLGPCEKLFDDNVRAYPEPNKVIKILRDTYSVLQLIG